MELYKASYQWANRPADERFASIREMYDACKQYADASTEVNGVKYSTLRAEASNGEVLLTGKKNVPVHMSHWAFGQLAARVGAPASYLRELPATLAAQNINHGLAKRGDDMGEASMLLHRNGSLVLRALTSEIYSRFWNHEICERLLDAESYGWQVPPARPALSNQPGTRPATESDVLRGRESGLSIQVGDSIAPAGLYASDHDMFAFLVNERARIEDNSTGGLARGIFVINSEVGAKQFEIWRFLYRFVCGNHIVWGASQVESISIRHVGDIRGKIYGKIHAAMRTYADDSASEETAVIKTAQSRVLGAKKDEVLDFIFGKRILSRKQAGLAYDAVQPDVDGDPRTLWGFTQGITRLSQATGYADDRLTLDAAAGKVLNLVTA